MRGGVSCVCVLSCHLFWTPFYAPFGIAEVGAPAEVTQEDVNTGGFVLFFSTAHCGV